MKESLGIKGEVTMFQTPIGVEGKVENAIPGTIKKQSNTIRSELKQDLAHLMADGTQNYAIDDLFTADGTVASVGAAQDGKQGIMAADDDDDDVTHIFCTTLNAGGDGTEVYVEFYGYLDGAATLSHYLILGSYSDSANVDQNWAYTAISETVAANRRFHFYWKITIS